MKLHHALRTTLASTSGWAPLPIRIALGLSFVAHGSQKLFAAFGGYGLEGTGQFMASIGLEPGYLMALMAGLVEFLGGLAVMLGLLTRPAALAAAVLMVVAIVTVHLPHGFFADHGGFEYQLTLLAGFVALLIGGAGRYSLDHLIVSRIKG